MRIDRCARSPCRYCWIKPSARLRGRTFDALCKLLPHRPDISKAYVMSNLSRATDKCWALLHVYALLDALLSSSYYERKKYFAHPRLYDRYVYARDVCSSSSSICTLRTHTNLTTSLHYIDAI